MGSWFVPEGLLGVDRTAWLHWLAGAALDRKKISSEQYVDWSANLIDAGQNYLGVTGKVLTFALADLFMPQA